MMTAILLFAIGPSYNQPKFSSCATWNPNAITFANGSTIGTSPSSVFVDINNTIYVAETDLHRVQVWLNGSMTPTRTIFGGLNSPFALFASMAGDIYVGNGAFKHQVDKWTLNTTTSVIVMNVPDTCFGLFMDTNDNLYCSITSMHQVIKQSLDNGTNTSTVVAGTGTAGSSSDALYWPRGIFVDINFNMYVADSGNDRIQLFQAGQRNATTVAGTGATGTISLNNPIAIVLDADAYLFISDFSSSRIIRSGPFGFRCLFGCTNTTGSGSDQLNEPCSISFDSYGNLFVADIGNSRIQKFLLITNSCIQSSTHNIQSNASSTFTTETSVNTVSYQNGRQSSPFFRPPACQTPTYIGSNCNISILPCDILKPCQNNGTCINNNSVLRDYICSCLPGFNGTECQYDYRPCQTNTCWNNGICYETSNTTFICTCAPGWKDEHCQTKINYCENITCLNKGVCQPLLLNYTCECLGNSYSGRYCEITANQMVVRQTVSKSFAYIAIIAILIVAMFIIIMDVLKYCFGIDPVDSVRQKRQSKKRKQYKKKNKPTIIIRFRYVNAPSKDNLKN